MIDRQHHKQQPPGVTLLLVMLILSIVSSVALAVTFLIVRQFEQGTDVRKAIEAQDIADTGVEKILYEVKNKRSGSANTFVNDLKTDYVCDDPLNNGILENGEFCVDPEASYEYENQLQTSLQENENVTLDLFDPAGPGGDEVTAIEISGSADSGAWIEVSWIGWTVNDGSFTYLPSTTKQYFRGSEISPSKQLIFKKTAVDKGDPANVYFVNNPFVTGLENIGQCSDDILKSEGCLTTADNSTPVNYIVRIKALFGDVPELAVKAYTNCVGSDACPNPTAVGLPARVAVKVIGRSSDVLQAVQLSIPWKFSLAGLYDYALLSTGTLEKTLRVNPGFYSTGTIQAEKGIDLGAYSTAALPNTQPNMPFQCERVTCAAWTMTWATVNKNSGTNSATQNVRCGLEPDIDASSGATCGFDDQSGRMSYSLSSFDLGEESQPGTKYRKSYYLNYRARLNATSLNEAMEIYVCDANDNCISVQQRLDEATSTYYSSSLYPNRNKDGWATCSALISLSSNDTLQFRANPDYVVGSDEQSPRLDWFNISTVAFTGQNNCTFTPLTYSRDSYTFEAEARMAAGETCGTGTECNLQADWFGYQRLAYAYQITPAVFSCDKDAGYCSIVSHNQTLGYEVGFTYPLEYESSPGVYSPKIAEGDYYVTVKGPHLSLASGSANQNDNFIFDIGNFVDNVHTSPTGVTYYGSNYLPGLNYLNIYRAQGPYDSTLGDGTNGCVLPKQMRVISGNAASITISDSNSGSYPTLDIDSFTLSHTPPKDASGNYIPLCTMLSGTPSAQWVQPSTSGSFFAPLTGPNTSPPAIFFKVNGEASQGTTTIDHIEAHATMEASPFTDYILNPISPPDESNPFRFIWPYNADPWSPIPPDGKYTLSAVAVDSNGLSTYPPTTITGVTIDTVKPQVSASYLGGNPFKEEVIGGVTHIKTTVTATDLNGIRDISVYSDAEARSVAYCSTPSGTFPSPFTCQVDFIPQTLPWNQGRFQVTANDRAGNNNTVYYYSDTLAPTVNPFTITQSGPVNGIYTGTVTVTAVDTANNGVAPSIAKIQLYSGLIGDFVGSACDYSSPYQVSQSCDFVFETDKPLNYSYFVGYATDANRNVGGYTFDPDKQAPTLSSFTVNGTPIANVTTYNSIAKTMRATVFDPNPGSGLDYIQMWTYQLVGTAHTNYTPIGECDYDGAQGSQTCTISWTPNTTTWPHNINYYIELRARDMRGRSISPSWGAVTIN